MLCIRINTLLRGHSGIRVQTLEALAAMLNRRRSCRWCRNSARSAHRATSRRCRISPSCCSAAAKPSSTASVLPAPRPCAAGLAPVTLSYKEGLALNNGTAQMLATGVLAVQRSKTCWTPPISPQR
jgi:histidine ammonia-lyase